MDPQNEKSQQAGSQEPTGDSEAARYQPGSNLAREAGCNCWQQPSYPRGTPMLRMTWQMEGCPLHGKPSGEPQRHHFPPLTDVETAEQVLERLGMPLEEMDRESEKHGPREPQPFPSDFDRIQALVFMGTTVILGNMSVLHGKPSLPESARADLDAMAAMITPGAWKIAQEMMQLSKPQEEERDADPRD